MLPIILGHPARITIEDISNIALMNFYLYDTPLFLIFKTLSSYYLVIKYVPRKYHLLYYRFYRQEYHFLPYLEHNSFKTRNVEANNRMEALM